MPDYIEYTGVRTPTLGTLRPPWHFGVMAASGGKADMKRISRTWRDWPIAGSLGDSSQAGLPHDEIDEWR